MRRLLLISAVFLTGCSDNLPYEIVGDSIPASLTETTGDINNGLDLFQTRSEAHCVLCHVHKRTDAPFPGNLGPDLTQVNERLNEGQIRLRIVDYDAVFPGTTMPSYYRTHGLNQVETAKKGQTVLTAQEIEDIIAFLMDETSD